MSLGGDPAFSASTGWLERFVRRHGFVQRLKTSGAQFAPDNASAQIGSHYSVIVFMSFIHGGHIIHSQYSRHSYAAFTLFIHGVPIMKVQKRSFSRS
jgi:hypothetical protein